MRICIDATCLLLRSAGVKNYTWHWMRTLQAESPQYDIRAFPMLGEVGELDHERSLLTLSETLPRIALLHLCNIRSSPLINLAAGKADIFHASNLLRNIPRKPKLTGTLYDLTVMLMPEVHTAGNVKAERRFYDQVLRKADGLIAISESSKNDAVRLVGLNPDRITVIYPGIDERFSSATPARRAKPYALFVGTIEPRKNVDTLIDAWLRLPASLREAHELLLAGPVGWAAQPTLERLHSSMPGIRYLGYVPESELPSLVSGARIFVYPSLYEGFGFPLAQAMAAGVPCVTSNISSLPEVAAGSALLVEPKDPVALCQSMERLLDSESLRESLGSRGRERAAHFTWKNSARQSAAFFERVAGL